ncbi:MAG: hypothetical protein H7Y86_04545 [Rhizobacter sp.]|nr:hypothetical protein [Ferruginibacter sp.]
MNIEGFLNDLRKAMYANPYNNVNIMPIVENYRKGLSEDEYATFRVRISNILQNMRDKGEIEIASADSHINLHFRSNSEFEEEIFVRGTIAFQENFKKEQVDSSNNFSYTFNGQANFVTHSSNVNFNITSTSDTIEGLNDLRSQVELDRSINEERSKILIESITEIQDALEKGVNQKIALNNLLSQFGDLASVASFFTSILPFKG